MFKFFIEDDLILPNQSGFKPGDSCINQLLSITHDIYKSFDCGYEVRGVFLDISKAFNKVWHDGIIFKLEQNSISGKLHKLLHDFFVNRKQRVVLNAQVSSWSNFKAGVFKVQSWAHCSFLSISMTYQKVSHQTLNCSLTIHHYFP